MSELALALTDDKVPAHVAKGNGRGNEDVTGSSLTIPRIKQLQKMSDEVDKHHPNYIEGADDGVFMNTLTRELYGEELYAINIKFKDEFVVWKDREKGNRSSRPPGDSPHNPPNTPGRCEPSLLPRSWGGRRRRRLQARR